VTLQTVLIVAGAYLVGAIPFGLLFAFWLTGKDPRQHGSGNIGATNVVRTGGKAIGLLTLIADIAKGAAPVALALYFADEITVALVAVAVFLGHLYPVYLRFKGGKGVATLFGIVLPWQPWLAVAVFVVWVIVFGLSRYVSLASILAGLSLPLFAWRLDASGTCIAVMVLLCLMMIARHGGNIRRLASGTELKVGGRER